MNNLGIAIEWKLKRLNKWQDQVSIRTVDGVLTEWNVTGMEQPDDATLQAWCDEYESVGLPEQNFNVDAMLGAMGLAFTGADAVNLSPYLSAIQNYASSPFRNFKGIKDFIAGLVAMNKATQEQADILTGIFAEQGIDLDNY
jgi:hypothetical protein